MWTRSEGVEAIGHSLGPLPSCVFFRLLLLLSFSRYGVPRSSYRRSSFGVRFAYYHSHCSTVEGKQRERRLLWLLGMALGSIIQGHAKGVSAVGRGLAYYDMRLWVEGGFS